MLLCCESSSKLVGCYSPPCSILELGLLVAAALVAPGHVGLLPLPQTLTPAVPLDLGIAALA